MCRRVACMENPFFVCVCYLCNTHSCLTVHVQYKLPECLGLGSLYFKACVPIRVICCETPFYRGVDTAQALAVNHIFTNLLSFRFSNLPLVSCSCCQFSLSILHEKWQIYKATSDSFIKRYSNWHELHAKPSCLEAQLRQVAAIYRPGIFIPRIVWATAGHVVASGYLLQIKENPTRRLMFTIRQNSRPNNKKSSSITSLHNIQAHS